MNQNQTPNSFSLLDDTTLAGLVKTQADSEALKELIERHTGVCVLVSQKYMHHPSTEGYERQDFEESRDYVIFRAAEKYNPEKGVKFSYFVGEEMRYYCQNSLNDNKTKAIFVHEPMQTGKFENAEDLQNYWEQYQHLSVVQSYAVETKADGLLQERKEFLNKCLNMYQNKRIAKALRMRFMSDPDNIIPYHVVGKKFKVAHETVRLWEQNFIKFAKKCLSDELNAEANRK